VVLPALHGDLLITKQKFEGQTYYVVKDPVSMQGGARRASLALG
jgi:hypothetical protein